MRLTIQRIQKLLRTGDPSILSGEPFIVIREPMQLAGALRGDDVHGWRWTACTHPAQPVEIDGPTGEELKAQFGMIRLACDRSDGSEIWGEADGSYLRKWKGFFASSEKSPSARQRRSGMTYTKHKSTQTRHGMRL